MCINNAVLTVTLSGESSESNKLSTDSDDQTIFKNDMSDTTENEETYKKLLNIDDDDNYCCNIFYCNIS